MNDTDRSVSPFADTLADFVAGSSKFKPIREMGSTLLAVHTGTGVQVIIRPVSRFQDERVIRHLAQLRHPALPRVMDEILAGPQESLEPYVILEYLEGETFAEWLNKAGGRLLPDQLLPLLAEAARALAFLHDQNDLPLLHLDLKPEHLVRLPDGHVGLIDFDCARLLPVEGQAQADRRCTTAYSAPELIAGQPTPQSDIYALGATMLVLLSGQPINTATMSSLSSLCHQLPPAVATIIETCLNSNPANRYPSAAALACALENACLQKLRLTVPSVSAKPLKKSAAGSSLESTFPVHFTSGIESQQITSRLENQQITSRRESQQVSEQTADLPGEVKPRHPYQIIAVWDHAAFAVNLGRHLAQTGRQTLLIDADLLNPRLDLLLELIPKMFRPIVSDHGRTTASIPNDRQPFRHDRQPFGHDRQQAGLDRQQVGLELALTAIMRKTLQADRLPDLFQKTDMRQLSALTGSYNLRDYDYFDPETLLELLRLSRLHADAVLVSCSRFLHDSYACLTLLAADLILIPVVADPASFREFNRYLDFLSVQYPFDRRKARFIAVDYDPTCQMSWGMMDELCEGLLAGCIERTKRPNARPTARLPGRLRSFLTKHASDDRYDQLLRRLGFAARPV